MSKITDEQIIKALEVCSITNMALECKDCPYDTFNARNCSIKLCEDALDLINRQQAEIERLTTIAKKMHSWIFTNSYDEEKAYAECGLTDEENILLGYCGKIAFESKEMVGEGK